MSRLNDCRTCQPDPPSRFTIQRGKTRHRDRICSWCREFGAPGSLLSDGSGTAGGTARGSTPDPFPNRYRGRAA